MTVDLSRIVPTVSGPRNPEESVPLAEVSSSFRGALAQYREAHPRPSEGAAARAYPSDDPLRPFNGELNRPGEGPPGGRPSAVDDGSVVIAAITSCTNTSNPTVMIGAGLIAKRARELGLTVPAHVKTSLAPGSKVVTDYLEKAGLLRELTALGFGVVGYGCTTCIGNSGPLAPGVGDSVREHDLFVAAVLSGNRNFEARIHQQVRANYLASPMLVVAYALAGRIDVDLAQEPLGHGANGAPVLLSDLWPTPGEVARLVASSLDPGMFREKYRSIEVGDAHWEGLHAPEGVRYPWSAESTYLAEAPYLALPPPLLPRGGDLVKGARALVVLGDKVSTDHISPAGEIPEASPAGEYLVGRGVAPRDFNTYGSRRGHHEVMIRGTFANVRLANALVAPREGGYTTHLPSGEPMTIFAAAERYRAERVPLLAFAGKSYGQGSSRDWAAKGPRLLGVGAVIAESYERIHRSNLIEMGVLPLAFPRGEGWRSLGLTGRESYDLRIASGGALAPRASVEVAATPANGTAKKFAAVVEIRFEHGTRILPDGWRAPVRHGAPVRQVSRRIPEANPTAGGPLPQGSVLGTSKSQATFLYEGTWSPARMTSLPSVRNRVWLLPIVLVVCALMLSPAGGLLAARSASSASLSASLSASATTGGAGSMHLPSLVPSSLTNSPAGPANAASLLSDASGFNGGLYASPAASLSARSEGASPLLGASDASTDVSPSTPAWVSSVGQSIADGQIPASAAYLPSLSLLNEHVATPSQAVSPLVTVSPAPMGIADFGLGADGPYSVYTQGVAGGLQLSGYNATAGTTYETTGAYYWDGLSPNAVVTPWQSGVQLNTVLNNVSYPGSDTGAFWTQNVLDFSGSTIQFIDNVWNLSSPGAAMEYGTIYSGSGVLVPGELYYDYGPTLPLSFPLTIDLYNNASIIDGRSALTFGYRIVEGATVFTGVYDTVVFNSQPTVLDPLLTPEYFITGFNLAPDNFLLDDAELVFGGPGGGSNAEISSMSGNLSLAFLNGSAWDPAPSAYDYGTDTGETAIGMAGTWSGTTESVSQGPSILYGLWNTTYSVPSGKVPFVGHLDPLYAFAFIGLYGTNTTNLSYAPSAVNGTVITWLPPSVVFNLTVFADGFSELNATFEGAVNAEMIELESSPGTWNAPLYMNGDAQAAELALDTMDETSLPYVFYNLNVSVNQTFNHVNDYDFPTFDLLWVYNLTATLVVSNITQGGDAPNGDTYYAPDYNGSGENLPDFGDEIAVWSSPSPVFENLLLPGYFLPPGPRAAAPSRSGTSPMRSPSTSRASTTRTGCGPPTLRSPALSIQWRPSARSASPCRRRRSPSRTTFPLLNSPRTSWTREGTAASSSSSMPRTTRRGWSPSGRTTPRPPS